MEEERDHLRRPVGPIEVDEVLGLDLMGVSGFDSRLLSSRKFSSLSEGEDGGADVPLGLLSLSDTSDDRLLGSSRVRSGGNVSSL